MALVALALPAPAAAGASATKVYKVPASVDAELDGKGTNGFEFLLFASKGLAFLSTSKEGGEVGETGVYYSDTSRHHSIDPTGGRIDLRIGHLGHFRGRFLVTSTKTEKPSRFCDGAPSILEKGHFVGSFSSAAKAATRRSTRAACPAP